MGTARLWLHELFAERPNVLMAFVILGILSVALYTRNPVKTNFIFDEQEALLANPYVRSVADAHPKFHWLDAFKRDFWGLPPDRSIGSYRPIPNLVWRALWALGARQSPFLHHHVNVLLHAFAGAVLLMIVHRWTRDRLAAWLTAVTFVACAVLTEAVSGVVGIADVLGGLGLILAIQALSLPLWLMPFGVFLAVSFGLYSKESALCAIPIVPIAALLTARYDHRGRPLAWARFVVSLLAALAAFIGYVEARRRLFPVVLPATMSVEAYAGRPLPARVFGWLLRWYAQPALPKDPINNPLADAPVPLRIAGALRVYFRGLMQILVPYPLSGDYSSPQEPVPARVIFPLSIAGGLAMVLPFVIAPILAIGAYFKRKRAMREGGWKAVARLRDYRPIIAMCLVWIVIAYIPVSNIPIVLPTVRAERFWYFPAFATSIMLGLFFTWVLRTLNEMRLASLGIAVIILFLAGHAFAARHHANDYADDLAFWDGTRKAAPRSAKAHLNYSVMLGARQDLEGRLASNEVALKLAPTWPMANVYMGDTLCRLHRAEEAWPHYRDGFKLAPNDVNLIALGLQCLWDEKALGPDSEVRAELEPMIDEYPGSWVAYLVRDTLDNGEAHSGVDPKYRPRGYNEGPKE